MSNFTLRAPDDFDVFPYNPYEIQQKLMRHLYSSIEDSKITVIESPTGTGKTLSLLCGSLTWLNDNRIRSKRIKLADIHKSLESESENNPDWVATQTFERMRRELEDREREYEDHLSTLRMEEIARKKHAFSRSIKRFKSAVNRDQNNLSQVTEEFMPLDHTKEHTSGILRDTEEITVSPSYQGPSLDLEDAVKIYFASRTHSQLSQVMQELLKLNFENQCIAGEESRPRTQIRLPKTVALASRDRLCINDDLKRRVTDLDEGCRELMTRKVGERCPYLPQSEENDRLNNLRDRILSHPCDIEDLVITGKATHTCPYFASRNAIHSAELVTLPYNMLLDIRSRQILGIDLENQVVIIDEAHNLIDSMLQIYSVELTVSEIRIGSDQLKGYLGRFRTLLKATHALNIKRLILFLSSLEGYLTDLNGIKNRDNSTVKSSDLHKSISVTAFVEKLGASINGVNLVELNDYLTLSKIARKAANYAKVTGTDGHVITTMVLHSIESFISCLTNNARDGVILVECEEGAEDIHLKYQHLNPASCFRNIIDQSRSVILAGGTMSPVADLHLQLWPSLRREDISMFSCGHVIPATSLQCLVIGKGPRNFDVQFKYKDRENQVMLDELGNIVFNLVNLVPKGMVIFFPSYSFLQKVRQLWTDNGLLSRLMKKKMLFQEPSNASEVDKVLQEYKRACYEPSSEIRGAVLLAVVGAKLSEGLNFSDDLARAVVIVGLPYPNLSSPGLKERMKFVSRLTGTVPDQQFNDPATELYENICMKAVNQSIGRAIRHKDDWASLILLDKRYGSQRVRKKLPGWITQNIVIAENFGKAIRSLALFYQGKQETDKSCI